MNDFDARLREALLASDDSFRQLVEDHQRSEQRLSELQSNAMPSPEEELEEKQLKLHKLALKDRMERILREHREERVPA